MAKILSIQDHLRLLQIERNLAVTAKRAQLQAKLKGNAEYQRTALMTKEQIGRRAIDLMTQNLLKYNRAKIGENATEAEARKRATELQHIVARNKDIE